MHGTFEAQARRAVEQTNGGERGIPLSLAIGICGEISTDCILIRLPTQKGRRFPPDVCAVRQRRGGFCAFAKQACARIGRIHKIGEQPSRLPPIFNLRFGVSFFERSAYLEIGNTTVPPRPYAAAYAGEETAVSSVRPKDTYRASLTCFIVRSSKWPIFSFRRRLSIVRICSSRMTEFFASPPSV